MTMEKVRKDNKMLITKSQKLKEKIELIAKQILKNMGIKIHHLGFKYWVTAIYMTLDIELNNREELK